MRRIQPSTIQPLHAGAWWAWAIGLVVAASRTTNPLLLALIIAVASIVVTARRTNAPWARSFGFFLRLGLIVIIIRVAAQIVFGAGFGRTVIATAPALHLPAWLGGLSIGGAITAESLAAAAVDGLRFATIIVCIGAATTLASPSRLLKSVPAVLYEFGTSVVIASTFTPMLVEDVSRVRVAHVLRGSSYSGPRAIARSLMPVLAGALERSVTLAAAMDARGYGRHGPRVGSARRWSGVALLGGLIAATVGSFALLSPVMPQSAAIAMLVLGTACAIIAVVLAARGARRTRYRPDPWGWQAWLVSASGAAAALGAILSGLRDPIAMGAMEMPVSPLAWPSLPGWATAGILIAALPAWLAPSVDARPDSRLQAGARR